MFSRPINVCHLGKYYPPAPGGIESHVQTLARAQASAGAKVRVICVNHIGRDGRDLTWRRYGVTCTTEDRDGEVRVTRLGRSACVARFDFIPGLPRLLLDLQYSPVDVIHVHTPNPTMLVPLVALRLNKPIVVTHHSDVVNRRVLVYAMRPLEGLLYRRASAIVCGSVAYADASPVLQHYLHKVTVVPFGCDLRPLTAPSPEAQAAEASFRAQFGDAPLWLSVGRCVYYKGLHVALEALARTPGRLLIIGEGPLSDRLRQEAVQLGVSDRVIWWGRATDAELVGAYRAATALWFPSNARSEAFGLVQIEAMASGCPVINTEIAGSGVSGVSLDGRTGFTVPVDDAAALARAAGRLASEPGLRESLSSAARARAESEFAAAHMARRTLGVYAGVLRSSQAEGRSTDAVEPVPARLSRWVREAGEPAGFRPEPLPVPLTLAARAPDAIRNGPERRPEHAIEHDAVPA